MRIFAARVYSTPLQANIVSGMLRRTIPFLLLLVVAAGLRLPRLADRPMHADEAILADKFGTLLETGRWRYDPGDYHGPRARLCDPDSGAPRGVRGTIDR